MQDTIRKIESVRPEFFERAQKRLDNLTKPPGSLGRLEDLAKQLVAITENTMPAIERKVVFTFAGDHGVTEEGVSAYPKEVTPQMVFNFIRGGAGINVLARHAGAEVIVVDVGVDHDFNTSPSPLLTNSRPDGAAKGGLGGVFLSRKVVRGTKNMMKGPAMTKDEAQQCIQVGIDLASAYVQKGYQLFGTGDMGIGNTTPSSAIASVMTGRAVADVTGRGTGINDESLKRKIEVIEESIRLNSPDPADALDVLAKVGGAEIGAIAGLILGAASHRIAVVIDGFISTAGAIIAYGLEPKTRDYMIAGHSSVEIGHRAMLEKMGLSPILDLNLRLGEGTGAALAMLMIEAGLRIYREMATFGEAGVSDDIVN
ncbi:MAG: nicotinate-nucleotide--dimethylbenzimidazole phosphoribosyltransferase [Nitrospirae bacterium]|nr:nicotinate-nucleotide--dimethylbenzimidazole phosphoribosyltransferase [Nitrospirota bacterium]